MKICKKTQEERKDQNEGRGRILPNVFNKKQLLDYLLELKRQIFLLLVYYLCFVA